MNEEVQQNYTAYERSESFTKTAWSMVAVGFVPLVTGCIILLLVSSIKHKRKELIFFTALCVSTLILGGGYTAAGYRRLYVLSYAEYFISPFDCLVKAVHNIMFEIGETTSALVMLLLTGDQLASMISFKWYLKFTSRKAELLLVLIYTLSCVVYAILMLVSLLITDQNTRISPFCYQDEAMPGNFYKVHCDFLLVAYYISFVVCLIALLCRKFMKKKNTAAGRLGQMIKQKKVVHRVSVIIFFRSIFQMIPMTLLSFTENEGLIDNMWLAHPLGLTLELILYSAFDQEIRHCVKRLCTGQACIDLPFVPCCRSTTNTETIDK
ncbi:hypothetical protein M514_01230 [Trichuris suis]|uniref:G-protein coupled receptors family 1 profile domain-containing protein n=2 Tax=Trichuris suis TaxID=68888 RepID=A0A085NMX0_9BILA|nr:hypothetical protein M514_01230 [Trichuris suis]